MKKRLWLTLITFALISCKTVKVSSNVNTTTKPNYIFFLVDDLGWKDCGFMGSKYYETPNIDKLASDGMVFTNAYANAPNCAPSRACLLSGLYTPRHGVFTVQSSSRGESKNRNLVPIRNITELNSKFTTLAEALKTVNYKTCHIGKWHLGEAPKTGPLAQGFDINIGGNHSGYPHSYFSPYSNKNLKDGPKGEYLTNRLTDEAIKFIKKNKNSPFFLYLSHYAVHSHLEAKSEITEKYKNKQPDGKQNNATYAAMIKSTDQSLEKIVETLEDLNLTENTIIIFYSDNGGNGNYTSMSPLKGSKGMMYEGGLRVPMIVKWTNKIKSNSTCTTPVIGIDFFPTIAKISNINTDSIKLDGKSLTPLLFKNGKFNREAIYWHFPAYLESNNTNIDKKILVKGIWRAVPSSAIRMGDWKLIEYFENGKIELFNLKEDIGENNNLVEIKPKIKEKLLTKLKQWRKKTNAPVPSIINYGINNFQISE